MLLGSNYRFNKILLFAVVTMFFFQVHCIKKKQPVSSNPIPSIPVQITVYPNDPLYFKVQAIGGWMYLNGGINGIVIYRKSQEEFVAIERSSSYLPNDANAKVKVLSDNFTLRDTVSDSRWRMFDGTVTQGPAQWSLRLYGTNYDGNVLRITN